MTTPSTPPNRAELADKLTRELLDLRDALMTLSLSLKDWQMDMDVEGRQISQNMAQQALAAFRLPKSGFQSGNTPPAP